MNIGKYFQSNWKTYIMPIVSIVVFTLDLFMFQMPVRVVIAPGLVCLEAMIIYMVIDYRKQKDKYRILSNSTQLIEEAFDNMPETNDVIEQQYQEMVKILAEKLNNSELAENDKYNAMLDYFSIWVHQIKTPISSMRLLLDGEDSKEARKVASELNRIEQYVEMVLTYLRLDSQTNDFVFRKCCIDEIVRQSIRRFARDFISKKLSLDYTGIEGDIVTDSKWFGFVIEQVLSNALKYTYEGGIRIYRQEDMLVISDTGIGIATEDLPRVFENSYTGYNGRSKEASSGIGLYLCKRICDSLGVKLCIESEVAKGTSVYIGLTQDNVVFKD